VEVLQARRRPELLDLEQLRGTEAGPADERGSGMRASQTRKLSGERAFCEDTAARVNKIVDEWRPANRST
jgi:hypothetical protein